MNDAVPLNDEEYRWYMNHLKEGNSGLVSEDSRAESLWQRHQAAIAGNGQARTAFHEAGHAVVSHACGYRVPNVLIRDDDSGETPWMKSIDLSAMGQESPRQQVVDLLNYTTIQAAGYVAEEIEWGVARYPEINIVGKVAPRWVAVLPQVSQLDANDRATLIPDPPAKHVIGMALAFVEQGEQHAERILRSNWDATKILAEALLARRRLEGEYLQALLAEVNSGNGH